MNYGNFCQDLWDGDCLATNVDGLSTSSLKLVCEKGVFPFQAKAGDIITSKGYEHIGICLSDGCTRVLSNSSSNGAFVWESDRNFGGYYDRSQYLHEAPTEEIYRVVR